MTDRYVLQFKLPKHARWQPTAWTTNSRKEAERVSNTYEGKDDERVWDRKKRCEVHKQNAEPSHPTDD